MSSRTWRLCRNVIARSPPLVDDVAISLLTRRLLHFVSNDTVKRCFLFIVTQSLVSGSHRRINFYNNVIDTEIRLRRISMTYSKEFS